jgi:hypothetical protein
VRILLDFDAMRIGDELSNGRLQEVHRSVGKKIATGRCGAIAPFSPNDDDRLVTLCVPMPQPARIHYDSVGTSWRFSQAAPSACSRPRKKIGRKTVKRGDTPHCDAY